VRGDSSRIGASRLEALPTCCVGGILISTMTRSGAWLTDQLEQAARPSTGPVRTTGEVVAIEEGSPHTLNGAGCHRPRSRPAIRTGGGALLAFASDPASAWPTSHATVTVSTPASG